MQLTHSIALDFGRDTLPITIVKAVRQGEPLC